MIQFKRGKTSEWLGKAGSMEPLAPGQPGYDTTRKKFKVGDGKSSWSELPYAGGLTLEEIIGPEDAAKERIKALKLLLGPLADLLSLEDQVAVITYGKDSPNKETAGQLYLQQFDSVPEADYVVSTGIDRGWSYRKWNSGIAECWVVKEIKTALNTALSNAENDECVIYYNSTPTTAFEYPISFISVPVETATLQGTTEGVWLSTHTRNTTTNSAKYRLAHIIKKSSTSYWLAISVKGRWK